MNNSWPAPTSGRTIRHRQRRLVDDLYHLRIGSIDKWRHETSKGAGTGLQRPKNLEPNLIRGELTILLQHTDQAVVSRTEILRSHQQRTCIGCNVGTFQRHRGQRIALQLCIIVQHEFRIPPLESSLVSCLARFQQPVVTQAIGDSAVVVALEVI